jgi:hypothetical protein
MHMTLLSSNPQQSQVEQDWATTSCTDDEPSSAALIYPRLGGLYPIPSLINHSCLANACRVFLADGTMLVRAIQAVGEGEEVRWPYIPPLQVCGCESKITGAMCMRVIHPNHPTTTQQSRSARQAALHAGFGFRCRCPRCRLEGGEEKQEAGDCCDSTDGSLEGRVLAAVGAAKRGVGEPVELETLVDQVEEKIQVCVHVSIDCIRGPQTNAAKIRS